MRRLFPTCCRPADLAAIAVLTTLAIVVQWHHPTGWTADDGFHVNFAAHHAWTAYLTSPELLRRASHANLTPVLNLFYSICLEAFGLAPQAWHLVLRMLSALSGLLLYGVFRQHMRPGAALPAAAGWLLGLPFLWTSSTLMTSHYMLGLVFALGSLWCFAGWVREGRGGLLAGAVLLYALAMFSKEVYVPLPALLVLYRPWRRSLPGLLPFAAALGVYLACRQVVLGSVTGGYRQGTYVQATEWSALADRLAQTPVLMLGGPWQTLTFAGAFLLATALAIRARQRLVPRYLAIVATSALMAAVPLLPLLSSQPLYEPDRYLLVSSCLVAFMFGWLLHHIDARSGWQHWGRIACTLAMGGLLLQQHWHRAPPVRSGLAMQSATYDLALRVQGPLVIVDPGLPADPAYWTTMLSALRDARATGAGQGAMPAAPLEMVPRGATEHVSQARARGARVFAFDAACRCYTEEARSADRDRASRVPAPS